MIGSAELASTHLPLGSVIQIEFVFPSEDLRFIKRIPCQGKPTQINNILGLCVPTSLVSNSFSSHSHLE